MGAGGDYLLTRLRRFLLIRTAVLVACCFCHGVAEQRCKTAPPVIFNFGDSNSDTGGLSAGMGYDFGFPEGRAFFHPPTGRVSDGRLILDFLCESVGTDYLRPYLDAVGVYRANFTNGANFAVAGAAVLPQNTAFNLFIQTLQFLRFQKLSLDLAAARPGQLVDPAGFNTALYTFDIGQNDLNGAFSSNTPFDQIVDTKIPAVLAEIKSNVLNLYGRGATRFWIHNTGPLGCLPASLVFIPRKGTPGEVDSVGCLTVLNDAARALNAGLAKLCDQLRAQLTDATVVYVDVFAIKYNVIANATSYGFDAPPFMACCGNGGPPYNFDGKVMCTDKGAQVCAEGTKYISWDGVHYSEAANAIFAAKIVSGNYSNPQLSFNDFCNS